MMTLKQQLAGFGQSLGVREAPWAIKEEPVLSVSIIAAPWDDTTASDHHARSPSPSADCTDLLPRGSDSLDLDCKGLPFVRPRQVRPSSVRESEQLAELTGSISRTLSYVKKYFKQKKSTERRKRKDAERQLRRVTKTLERRTAERDVLRRQLAAADDNAAAAAQTQELEQCIKKLRADLAAAKADRGDEVSRLSQQYAVLQHMHESHLYTLEAQQHLLAAQQGTLASASQTGAVSAGGPASGQQAKGPAESADPVALQLLNHQVQQEVERLRDELRDAATAREALAHDLVSARTLCNEQALRISGLEGEMRIAQDALRLQSGAMLAQSGAVIKQVRELESTRTSMEQCTVERTRQLQALARRIKAIASKAPSKTLVDAAVATEPEAQTAGMQQQSRKRKASALAGGRGASKRAQRGTAAVVALKWAPLPRKKQLRLENSFALCPSVQQCKAPSGVSQQAAAKQDPASDADSDDKLVLTYNDI